MTDHDFLGRLLAPISVDVFLERHLRTRSLHVPSDPSRFEALGFDHDSFRRLLAGGAPGIERLRAAGPDRSGVLRDLAGIRPEHAPWLFRAGFVVVLPGVHRMHPALGAQAGALGRALGHPLDGIETSALWNPPGGGFTLHYDEYDVFTLQLQGSKTWHQ